VYLAAKDATSAKKVFYRGSTFAFSALFAVKEPSGEVKT